MAGPPKSPPSSVHRLEKIAHEIRTETVEVLQRLGHDRRGHPGASLSITDIITALYFHVLRIDPSRPQWAERDRFVLSKGHGCLALYVALAKRGFFTKKHLEMFRCVDGILQGHPDSTRTPGVDMSSGSLGNGLSAAIGLALQVGCHSGARPRVYVLMGDGELQEGLIWEGAMTAAKYRLNNLVGFVDCNRLQSSGRVKDIMPLDPLAAKWRSFGWRVIEIDGHEIGQILMGVEKAKKSRHKPTVILANTVKGKGVRYMEDDNAWHQRWPSGGCKSNQALDSGLGQVQEKVKLASTRSAYGEALLKLAREGRDIAVISADNSESMGVSIVAREFPARCFEVGVAEQNMMMIAAGMAASDKLVFTNAYAVFATMRTCEQIRTFIANPRLNVKIMGGLAGFSAGIEGAAHIALEDIGVMRTIPNMVILNPADAVATMKAVRAAADYNGPVYIRLGRDPSPIIFGDCYSVVIGKAVVLLQDGLDAVIMTSGLITPEVLNSAAKLREWGIGCTVVEFLTIKPLDVETVISLANQTANVFTVEEHSVIGGLGSAVAEVLSEFSPTRVIRIGVPDCFAESGTPEQLRTKYGLTSNLIASRIRTCLQPKPSRVPVDQERGHKSVAYD